MSDNKSDSAPTKRPYATLDLKATEIKVTSLAERSTASAASSAAAMAAIVKAADVPMPLPARRYATAAPSFIPASTAAATGPKSEPAKVTAAAASSAATATPASTASASAAASKPTAANTSSSQAQSPAKVTAMLSNSNDAKNGQQTVIVKKRGGFFSHLAASIIGGAVALGAWGWGLPELNKRGLLAGLPFDVPSLPMADGSSKLADRLTSLEKSGGSGEIAAKLQAAEDRLAALEKSAGAIGEIKDQQTRFVAETKAALAAAASDAGVPAELERLAAVEAKLKAMTDAGAGDPNAGRVEQLAALTGKVADLETSLATQLTALRKSVAGDVEARLVSAAEAAEAAKSGTQRIDRDLAGVKTDAAKLDERLVALKSETERAQADLKRSQDELAALKSGLEGVKSSTAKPADVASAVGPVAAKITTLEQDLKNLAAAEEVRRSNAERVVLALELQNLKRALDRGQRYDAELAEVEKAAGGKFDLTALAKFKSEGVPTVADLGKDFRGSANAMIDAETGAENATVVDRLIAGARSVVRVRKVSHDPQDKSAEAVAGRMEIALKEGRLGDVLTEAGALSAKAKEAVTPFLDKVSARAGVDSAIASLEGQLKTSMSGAPAGEPTKTQ